MPAHLQAQTIAQSLRCSCSGTLAHSGVSVSLLPPPPPPRITLVSNEHDFLGSLSLPVRLWWLPYSVVVGRIVTDEGHLEPQSDSEFLNHFGGEDPGTSLGFVPLFRLYLRGSLFSSAE